MRTRAFDQVLRDSRRGATAALRLGFTTYIDFFHSVSPHSVHYRRNVKSKPLPRDP